jgi:hypothetical protein
MDEAGLDELLKGNGVPDAVGTALKQAPYGIKSIKQLANIIRD